MLGPKKHANSVHFLEVWPKSTRGFSIRREIGGEKNRAKRENN